MRHSIALLLSSCVCCGLFFTAPIQAEEAVPLKQFDPVIKPADVRPHIEFLASDTLKGRSGPDAVAASEYLKRHFQKLGLKPLFETGYFQNIPGPKTEAGESTIYGRNVGAWLPGSDEVLRDEFIIVSAHFDHLGARGGQVFRGADDNASGTSMLLEVARQFTLMKERPKRSLVFIGFDLEENMLWGSRWFAAHAPWPLEKVKLFTTADMIGRSLGNLPLKTCFVMGSEHGKGVPLLLDDVGEPQGFHIARLGIDLIGTRSDYGPFRDQKVPFLFFSTGEHPDYHTPGDVPERIDYEQVAAVSGLVLRVTHAAANSVEAPQWVDDTTPRMDEVVALNNICKLLLVASEKNRLSDLQKFVVQQAEQRTRQIITAGKVTTAERKTLIHTAQILLLSVF